MASKLLGLWRKGQNTIKPKIPIGFAKAAPGNKMPMPAIVKKPNGLNMSSGMAIAAEGAAIARSGRKAVEVAIEPLIAIILVQLAVAICLAVIVSKKSAKSL